MCRKIIPFLAAGIFASLLLVSGCNRYKESKVDKIHIVQGDNQCALPESECGKDLIVELQGPNIKGFLGGKGNRYPVSGVKVRFRPLPGSSLTVIPSVAESDSGGGVRVKIKTGKVLGDQYLKIIPEGSQKTKTIRIINGISIDGDYQEGYVGTSLKKPIVIKVLNSSGVPVEGAPVFFHVSDSPEKGKAKASVKKEKVLTNAQGIAETGFKFGSKTGEYKITAEVMDKNNGIFIRGIEISEMGLDLSGLIFTVLGGLAIFIYGMKLMSDGLQLVAGAKMKTILHFFTSNRFVAVLAGTLVTAVIQSSSACTVMVIGFVNAGLLNLTQAIGIVFGANIGTTVTAQMISFKLGWLSLPAIILGLLVMMLAKQTFIKGWGRTVFGFGILFFGMGMMGDELKLIGNFPAFVSFFKTFNCYPLSGEMPIMAVFGAIGIGALMTVIIQSSSASMGIILALAGSGLIDFYTSVPLLLGTNIGTCVTAVIAAIPANKPSKQTALAHLLFNLLGTALMILFFYVPYPGTNYPVFLRFVNMTTQGDVFAEIPQNLVRHIAMAHTFFNVINVILFLPFIGLIAKLCNMIVHVEKEELIELKYLEPHLLNTPSIAIEQAVHSIRYMVKEAWAMVQEATNKCFMNEKTDIKITSDLAQREEKVDNLQQEVTDYLVQLTSRKLTEPQAAIIPLLMHCTNDAERIADHTENILSLAKRLEESSKNLSESGKEDMLNMWKILSDQAGNVIACLNNTDKENIDIALDDEKEINKLADKLEESHLRRLQERKCDPVAGIVFIEMITELERIGDHLSNIAERAPQIQKHHVNLS
jgi:Na/Pi-cotransporter